MGLALLALLVGQWAILGHSIAHARTPDVAERLVDVAHKQGQDWGHEAGTSACDLVEHLLTGQAPGEEHEVLLGLAPVEGPAAVAASSNAPGLVSPAYEARGPPWA
jgi:hypothetical protein